MNKEFIEWLERAIEIAKNNTQNKYDVVAHHEQAIILAKYNELHKPVVIPKYVADWVIRHRGEYDLYPALRMLEHNTLIWERIYKWYRTNTHKFVNAYLTGEYTVEEEEPLYRVSDGSATSRFWFLCKNNDGDIEIGTNKAYYEADWDGLKLTEQEIKDYDERYWAFAKPVEEDEE